MASEQERARRDSNPPVSASGTWQGHRNEQERACPYCGEAAPNAWAEVAHMEQKHPEVVVERLRAAGLLEPTDPTTATRAEAMSAAALDQDNIEVLVVTRHTRQAFVIGPVAANSLIWLLKQALDEMEA